MMSRQISENETVDDNKEDDLITTKSLEQLKRAQVCTQTPVVYRAFCVCLFCFVFFLSFVLVCLVLFYFVLFCFVSKEWLVFLLPFCYFLLNN